MSKGKEMYDDKKRSGIDKANLDNNRFSIK